VHLAEKPSSPAKAPGAAEGGQVALHGWSRVEYCLLHPGARIVCIREVQKTLAQSAKLLIENKIQEFGVGSEFRVLYDRIETPGGGLIIFQGMQGAGAILILTLLNDPDRPVFYRSNLSNGVV
jgi:phage terminase large subunit